MSATSNYKERNILNLRFVHHGIGMAMSKARQGYFVCISREDHDDQVSLIGLRP